MNLFGRITHSQFEHNLRRNILAIGIYWQPIRCYFASRRTNKFRVGAQKRTADVVCDKEPFFPWTSEMFPWNLATFSNLMSYWVHGCARNSMSSFNEKIESRRFEVKYNLGALKSYIWSFPRSLSVIFAVLWRNFLCSLALIQN